jgi:D-serine deaminase-like pyridoxal phosphate-dependent protein
MGDWYSIDNIGELDTPALVVYPARVRENISKAVEMVGDPARLRPHVKTHKSPEVTRMLLQAGIRQFKCATIAEAEMLAMEDAPDVLLAYQPAGPKAVRLAELVRKYPGTKFSCLIDNEEAAREMAAVFAAAGLSVPVWLDINVGMDRTGIAAAEAGWLYELAKRLEGIIPVGLHAYDGHIRDADPVAMTAKIDAAFAGVRTLRETLGGPAIPMIAGGSPTFPVHARNPDVQCSPGTFVYWDKGYADQFPDEPFKPAALVVSRVISLRGWNRICVDLGHKSIAAENEIAKRVSFLNVQGLRPVGQSEEHLVLETTSDPGGAGANQAAGHDFRIGDIFYGIPFHVCPTVALYDRAYTVENGRVTGEWRNTARDRKLTV